MNAKETFQTFENLEAHQIASEFRRGMYDVAKKLPEIEKFGLASQIRRAAVSLTNNIAEGHGRFHYLDQIKFMLQARGSLQELIDDLNICSDEKYFPAAEIEKLKQRGWRVSQVLGGYIRYLRQCKTGEKLGLREMPTEYTAATDDEFPDVTMYQCNDLTSQSHDQINIPLYRR